METLSKEILSQIPRGFYCYDEKGKCPFWSIVKNLPEQENGHCSYLKKSDWDLNEAKGNIEWENKDGEVVQITKPHEIGISLLWDQVKECGINEYTDEEILSQIEDENKNE